MHREPPDFMDRVFAMDTQDRRDTGKSKLLRDTSLSQHRVGGVPGQDFRVHGKRRSVIGLYQISWSSLSGRSK